MQRPPSRGGEKERVPPQRECKVMGELRDGGNSFRERSEVGPARPREGPEVVGEPFRDVAVGQRPVAVVSPLRAPRVPDEEDAALIVIAAGDDRVAAFGGLPWLRKGDLARDVGAP